MTANPACPLLGGTCKPFPSKEPYPESLDFNCNTAYRGNKCCQPPFANGDQCVTCCDSSEGCCPDGCGVVGTNDVVTPGDTKSTLRSRPTPA